MKRPQKSRAANDSRVHATWYTCAMPSPGQTIDAKYRLQRELGTGGFGAVWLATDENSGSHVAIKFLHAATGDARRRFANEARALGRLRSPFCLRPLDYGIGDGDTPYLVTEYVAGLELDQWLTTSPPRSQVLAVAADILKGLDAAHREGVVHRDLKPANVLIRDVDGRPQPAIIDFGLAKLVGRQQQDVTKTGMVMGTPGFMSPEQLRGQRDIGPPTDVYAFGALFFEVLTGKPPFDGDSALALAMAHIREPVPRMPPSVPTHVAVLVRQMLDKEPERRPTAMAALRVLTSAETASPAAPRRSVVSERGAIGMVLLLFVVGAIVWQALDRDNPAPVRLKPTVTIMQTAPAPPDPIADAATADAHDATNSSCKGLRRYAEGIQTVQDVWVRVPPDYDPTRRYRMLVLFHDGWQEPERALHALDYAAVGGARDYVIVAPLGNPLENSHHWLRPGILDAAEAQIRMVADEVCVDVERPYVLGYGHGGRAGYPLMCRFPQAIALATFAHRLDDTVKYERRKTVGREREEASSLDVPCFQPGKPVLSIMPRNDPTAPADGSSGCRERKAYSIPRHTQSLRDNLECRGEPTRVGKHCEKHQCAAVLETCVVKGGRGWPGAAASHGFVANAARLVNNCPDKRQTRFPVLEKAFAFFEAASNESGESGESGEQEP